MKTQPSPDACPISVADAVKADKHNAMKAMQIVRCGEVYSVFIRLTWRKENLFLTTTRSPKKPRTFCNLDRLIAYVQTNFPNQKTIELFLDKADTDMQQLMDEALADVDGWTA